MNRITVLKKWLQKNTFKVHMAAFLLMIVPGALLYPAGMWQATGWIGLLLSLVITGNILVLLVR